jgi:AcrR family transcriptional regulator
MRDVAEAAGMSVRLIQYYFGTKERLLLFATQYLAARLAERAMARIKAAGTPAEPGTVIEAILADDIKPLSGNSDALIRVVADQLRRTGRRAAGAGLRPGPGGPQPPGYVRRARQRRARGAADSRPGAGGHPLPTGPAAAP